MTRLRSRTTTSAVTDRTHSMRDHVLNVWPTVILKYSLTSQNPASFTWLRNTEPAPIASTISATCVGDRPSASGATMPAAVTVATVAEPVATRISTATSHAASSGEI